MSWCETYSPLSYLRLQNICRTVSWKHNDMEIQEIQAQTGSTWVGTTSCWDAPTDVAPLLQTSHGKQQTVTQERLGNGPCSHFQQESSPWAAFSLGPSKLVPWLPPSIHWDVGFGAFFSSLIKSGLGNGFVLMVLGQKGGAKNRLNACHGHGVTPTQNSALYLHK